MAKEICLHGEIDLTVVDAERAENTALVWAASTLPVLFISLQPKDRGLMLACLGISYLSAKRFFPLKHPRVSISVCVAGSQVAQTGSSSEPTWNESFTIPLAHPVTQVEFHVKREGSLVREDMGTAFISAEDIVTGEPIDKEVLVKRKFFNFSCPTYVHVKLKFTPCHKNPKYSKGAARDQGLEESYFPLRRGGKVTLYQDAHVIEGMLSEIELDNNKTFKHENCWEDICHAILEAKHLVYIVGWSIYHKVKLLRETSKQLPPGVKLNVAELQKLNLGELLKHKSQQGVKVLLLIWRDKAGKMKTHDKETYRFFLNSGVTCVWAHHREFVDNIIYSHHQKCVLVDTHQNESCKRRIIAFLGGLDLADGRYDTPKHRLFCDLDTECKDDYYNPMFSSIKEGPRQPWHDLHCRLEGPAVYDVLKNFKQRWIRATKSLTSERNSLIKIDTVPWMISPLLQVTKEDDLENWNVQVFRSIDSTSGSHHRKKGAAAKKKRVRGVYSTENLVPRGSSDEEILMLDRSVQMAYIEAIRSAQHFIYIENQYFIGSSYAWSSHNNAGANNLIPMELALKIINKIRANERFAVYVVIPMWPDGHPTAKPQILCKQAETMRMMYRMIAEELKSAHMENVHPTDYLNFYCLGNKEKPPQEMNVDSQTSLLTTRSGEADCKESAPKGYRRFMIYVHSKGMIVDDEYVILGSANINERSMAGSRDTEIAIGAYQPYHTWAKKEMIHPHGQVYGYRMSLWAEHLGKLDDLFKEPEHLDCVKEVNRIADENWTRYAEEEFTSPLQGHILKYPVQVKNDGTVSSLPGHETFPDVNIKILGDKTILPDTWTA